MLRLPDNQESQDELTESELDNLGSQGYVLVGVVPLVEADTDDRGYRTVEKYNQLISPTKQNYK
jgi:hypothetical protein